MRVHFRVEVNLKEDQSSVISPAKPSPGSNRAVCVGKRLRLDSGDADQFGSDCVVISRDLFEHLQQEAQKINAFRAILQDGRCLAGFFLFLAQHSQL